MANSKKISFDALKIGEIADCFHVTRRTVNDWIEAGCPRNRNKTMGVNQVHKWLIDRSQKRGKSVNLKDQKTEMEIERLSAQVAKIKGEYVEKSYMDTVLASRAKSLSLHLERSAVKNTIYYQGKTLQEMQALRFREAQEAMEAYLGTR